jgi:diaminopimelate epimerase
MKFAKYQGVGNDFVLFADPDDRLEITEVMAARLCDRRFGIGADGVIRVAPGRDGVDFMMDYRNSDGSIGEMCGNGIRCLAIFARKEGLTDATELKIATGAGIKALTVMDDDRVRVDMGSPIFEPAKIPVDHTSPFGLRICLPPDFGECYEFDCVSIGNPHAVTFVEDIDAVEVERIGRQVETSHHFPNKANVEFVRVVSPEKVETRVWERGSGQTLACGTGACAVGVVARLQRNTNEEVTVVLPGGELQIEWSGAIKDEQPVFMTGPVEHSFEGDVDLDSYRGVQ